MAICVTVSGSSLVTSSTSLGSCTDYVLYTAADYNALNPVLSVTDTVDLAWMVVAVWAAAWAVKVLRRTL